MNRNGNATKIDIALLKQKVQQISENELAHIREDLKDIRAQIQSTHEKIDRLGLKVAYYGGALMVVIMIFEYLFRK